MINTQKSSEIRIPETSNEIKKPLFGRCEENLLFSQKCKAQFPGMQCLTRQDQFFRLFICHAIFHEGQVTIFISSIQFIPNNRMPDVPQMNADLMFAAGK